MPRDSEVAGKTCGTINYEVLATSDHLVAMTNISNKKRNPA